MLGNAPRADRMRTVHLSFSYSRAPFGQSETANEVLRDRAEAKDPLDIDWGFPSEPTTDSHRLNPKCARSLRLRRAFDGERMSESSDQQRSCFLQWPPHSRRPFSPRLCHCSHRGGLFTLPAGALGFSFLWFSQSARREAGETSAASECRESRTAVAACGHPASKRRGPTSKPPAESRQEAWRARFETSSPAAWPLRGLPCPSIACRYSYNGRSRFATRNR
jgi:hypothetical protein